jgi:hypothetical protein
MTMVNALLFGILPAILLLWIGSYVRASVEDEKGVQRWLLFLLGVPTLLLITQVIAISMSNRASFFVSLSFLPVACGTVAYLFLHLLSGQITRSRGTVKTLLLFLIVVFLFISLGLAGNLAGLAGNLAVAMLFIILGGALLALVWKVWIWIGRWYLAVWAVQMMFLCVSIWATDANTPLLETPPWLVSIVKMAVGFLIPGLAIIVAARLVYMSQVGDQSKDWRKVILILLLAASILVLMGYQIVLASVWDVATDGLAGIFLWLLISVLGIAAAMVMAWFLPNKRKLLALAFALIVPILMRCAFWIGTYGPDGKWGMSPAFVTERRAEMIDRAIQRYYEQRGGYPRVLNDLVPRNLVYIPQPIMIPGQTWCYEGGHDYYRLGYVYRQYFSTPASVRVYAAIGEPPVLDWACEDEAAKYPGPPGYYDP